jgi:hypothetical protein
MVKYTHMLAQAVPSIFAILAFGFSLRAITSPDWSIRRYYDSDYDPINWTHPLYHESRSPFYICGVNTTQIRASDGTLVPYYNKTCVSYPAIGKGKRSCEVVSVTLDVSGSTDLKQTGTALQCTQVHLAANLSIAATVLIGFGFLIALLMTGLSFLSKSSREDENVASSEITAKAAPVVGEDGVDERKNNSNAQPRKNRRRYSSIFPASPYLNLLLIASLAFGAILYFLAQFFGIMAFTVSAPDNGRFASQESIQGNDHDPWISGAALTTYGSLAWIFAGLAAVGSSFVWRMPRFSKIL